MDTKVSNNTVSISGEVVSPFNFSHYVFGEGFYNVMVAVSRLSSAVDMIPVTVSERLVNVDEDLTGQKVNVRGQFRSYNQPAQKGTRLLLFVFAAEFEIAEDYDETSPINNVIELFGYVCKPPVYRKTMLGREIADVFMAVNRAYGKSDYIPCIAWGRNARFAGGFHVGDEIHAFGRIQSREYIKQIGDGEEERRVAYEVSISKMELTGSNNLITEEDVSAEEIETAAEEDTSIAEAAADAEPVEEAAEIVEGEYAEENAGVAEVAEVCDTAKAEETSEEVDSEEIPDAAAADDARTEEGIEGMSEK